VTESRSESRADSAFNEFDDLVRQAEQLTIPTPRDGWSLETLRAAVRAARRQQAPVEQATAAPGEKRTVTGPAEEQRG
jgi:hypothetical protein